MGTIKAVLFDLGGTLVNVEPPAETFSKILRARGIARSAEAVEMAIEKVKERLGDKGMAGLGPNLWVKVNLLILKELGVKEGALPLAKAIEREWWDYANFSLFPEVLEALRGLKEKGLKLGVVTNSPQADTKKVLRKLSINGLFDVEVGIDSVGKPKPDREIFDYAVKKLGLKAEEVLFVGDEVEADYEGARRAGLRALLLDREGKVSGDVSKIKDLREILSIS